MSGTVENSINVLVSELKNNRNTEKDEALDYVGYVFRMITQNNIPLDQRHGAAMTVDACITKVRGGDFRRAEGFYGNWAKQLHDQKGESHDDLDNVADGTTRSHIIEDDDYYNGC